MSSILDALEKLERRQAVLRESGAPADRPARYGGILAAVLFAFVAGVGIAFGLRPGTQAPVPAVRVGTPPPAPTPAAPAPAPPLSAVPSGPPPAAGERIAPVAVPPVPAPEPPPVRVATATAPAPPPALTAATRPPTGAPRLKVSFLVYSTAPERRRIALSIDDAALVTLHEGESAHDVEVERIFADHVQLRHGGRTFTLRARD